MIRCYVTDRRQGDVLASAARAIREHVDIIQVRGTTDFFGHSYFISNPRVSGDIIYNQVPPEPADVLTNLWRAGH